MTHITEKNIQLEGCAIHCLECGELDWPTVVLLHGMKFQAETWRELGTIEALAGLRLHVLAIDLPGFGKSPNCACAPGDVLMRVLQNQNLDRVALIGPSMGGRIALEFASQFPQHVSALVLVGAVGVTENQHDLPRITAPSLLIWGGDDQVSPLSNSDILLSCLARVQREIYEGAPHPCYLAQAERWHDSLRRFFSSFDLQTNR